MTKNRENAKVSALKVYLMALYNDYVNVENNLNFIHNKPRGKNHRKSSVFLAILHCILSAEFSSRLFFW